MVVCLISAPLHHSPSALFTTISLPQRPCLASFLSVSDPSFSLSPPHSPLFLLFFLFAPLHLSATTSVSLFTHPLTPSLPPLSFLPYHHHHHHHLVHHSLSCCRLLNELIRLIFGTLLPKPVPTGPAAALL